MPPKKKSDPARRASGKRVRIGESVIIPSSPISPSGRTIRQATVGINYKLTANRIPRTEAKNSQGTQDVTSASPKRRGRPPTAASAKPSASTEPVKAARGRPKRDVVEPTPAVTSKTNKRKREVDEEAVAEPPKKRGRPPKAVVAPTTRKPLAKKVDKKEEKKQIKPPAKQVAKKSVPKAPVKVAATKKGVSKIGRPPGSKNIKTTPDSAKPAKTKTPKKSATAAGAKLSADTGVEEEFVEGLTQPDEEGAADFQYWLMKAEPDSRIEKGVDVAYPIDKLAAAVEPEAWDGVRSAVARNKMRAMRKGDLAFFYHSNCAVPGIVGVMRIAEEHSIDQSAFDPTHPYYDEKSTRSKPKWDCVKVEFVKKFSNIITLKELKSTPELSEMQVAQNAYGRLSVQNVKPEHWQFVLKMADEPEDLGAVSNVSGYEADTNGETDKDVVEDSIGADEMDEDVDVDVDKIAAYGDPSDLEESGNEAGEQLNGAPEPAINDEVQAEKDRVEAIDAFAKDITSSNAA